MAKKAGAIYMAPARTKLKFRYTMHMKSKLSSSIQSDNSNNTLQSHSDLSHVTSS